jgi:hypothetical protein
MTGYVYIPYCMSGNADGDLLTVECPILIIATYDYIASCLLLKQLIVPNNHTYPKAKEGNLDD